MATVQELLERRNKISEEAFSIHDAAVAAGRDLTKDESERIVSLVEKIKNADRTIDGKKLIDSISSLDGTAGSDSGAMYLGLTGASGKAWSADVATKMSGSATGLERVIVDGTQPYRKSLIPVGTVATAVPLIPTDVLAMGRIPASLLEILPVTRIPSGSRAEYFRQNLRQLAAAPVAQGAPKPESKLGTERLAVDLEVVAHISEPTPTYWLSDSAALRTFVEQEMGYGLAQAIEGQVINGTGVSPQLDGILAAGIQTVAALADGVLTARRAITAIETAGYAPRVFVLNPTDWEVLETTTFSGTGEFALGPAALPVDRAAQKLWGCQVVVSMSIGAGTGLLLGNDTVSLFTDAQGVQVAWSEAVGEDFRENNTRCRVEGRFQCAVTAPLGIAKLDLTVPVIP